MTTAKHTSTPWHYDELGTDYYHIEDINHNAIAKTDREANAFHIVKCVNSHETLINALKKCQNYFIRNEHFLPETQDREEIASIVLEALESES